MSFASSKICKLWKNDVFFYCKILSFINILFFLQMTRSFDCLIPPMFKLTNLAFRECPHINMVCSTETQDHILKIAGYKFWLHILDTVNIEYKLVNKLINNIQHSVFEYFQSIKMLYHLRFIDPYRIVFEDISHLSCLVLIIRIPKFHCIFAKCKMIIARNHFCFYKQWIIFIETWLLTCDR